MLLARKKATFTVIFRDQLAGVLQLLVFPMIIIRSRANSFIPVLSSCLLSVSQAVSINVRAKHFRSVGTLLCSSQRKHETMLPMSKSSLGKWKLEAYLDGRSGCSLSKSIVRPDFRIAEVTERADTLLVWVT